MSTADVLLSH